MRPCPAPPIARAARLGWTNANRLLPAAGRDHHGFLLVSVMERACRRSTQLASFALLRAAPLPPGAMRARCDRRLGGPLPWLPMKPRNGPWRNWKETIMAKSNNQPKLPGPQAHASALPRHRRRRCHQLDAHWGRLGSQGRSGLLARLRCRAASGPDRHARRPAGCRGRSAMTSRSSRKQPRKSAKHKSAKPVAKPKKRGVKKGKLQWHDVSLEIAYERNWMGMKDGVAHLEISGAGSQGSHHPSHRYRLPLALPSAASTSIVPAGLSHTSAPGLTPKLHHPRGRSVTSPRAS